MPGTFEATPKPSKKAPVGKVSVAIALTWTEPPMYAGCKVAIYVPPLLKVVNTTLPGGKRTGEAFEVTLTLPAAM